ncbi:hypothetical protein niasHT_014254 [Heterodera trifolii]|uniref:Polyadenylate-binding protein, cytoplasmic and nuclear n=1 Tax=Heterodera trifolii TaxID=157864 RepID=A0ABD2KX64_9BILA
MAQAVAAVAPAPNANAASAQTTQPQVMAPSYPLASLYVGDLHPARFSNTGPVLSIRVCHDAVTRRSLGYAYVNFQQPADAERALDITNFDVVLNRPIRIMWSQRGPSIRRSCAGNIFNKNLGKDIDTKAIYDHLFNVWEHSELQVMCDEHGRSKGIGFVCFEKVDEAATKAVVEMNNKIIREQAALCCACATQGGLQSSTGLAIHATLGRDAHAEPCWPHGDNAIQNQRAAPFMQTPNLSGAQMRGAVPRWNNMGGFNHPMQGYMMGPAGGGQFGGANQIARGGPRSGGMGGGGGMRQYGGQPRHQQNRMPGMGGGGHQQQGMRYQGQPKGMQQQQQQQAQQPQIAYSSYPQQQSRGMAPQMGGGASGGGGANAAHAITATHQEPLNTLLLTETDMTGQKQMLGERLYAMVARCFRDGDVEKVGKITGMLLEMENAEILLLLGDEEMLRLRVDEAATVLYQATGQKEAQ